MIFICIAGAYACGIGAPHGPTFSTLTAHGGFAPMGLAAILSGVTTVIFSFVGAEIVTIAAAESNEGAKAIARLTSSVRGANPAVLRRVDRADRVDRAVDRHPSGRFAVRACAGADRHSGCGYHHESGVLTAVLSCLNSGIYVTSRVLFTLAAKGDAPQWLVVLNKRQVPARAILAGAAFGYLAMGAAILSPTRVFTFLVDASGAIALVNYLLVALAEIRLRRIWQADAPERLGIKMWLFPYASWATVGVILAVLVAMAANPAERSEFTSSLR